MDRLLWKNKALDLLKERNILWIAGVRRVGKTTLCKSLPGAAFFDCELPRVRAQLEDPEYFLRSFRGSFMILDEIHRLTNPSEILKITADHFPKLRIVATGSSTLAVKSKFRDALTGRKRQMWLLPAIAEDLRSFAISDLDARMLRGGLPPFLLAETINDRDYIEWIDSFWAKDVQELFTVEKRTSFMKFIELVFRQSGALFEAQAFAAPCEISRQTVQNYLAILETTLLVVVLRPYSGGSAVEIKAQPKVFAFDTGFVCFFRGIDTLRDEDRGQMLEHLVLNELLAVFERGEVFYWRDKQKHEVDFVVKHGRSKDLIAIECKSRSSKFSAEGLASFRHRYPSGQNVVVCLDKSSAERRRVGDLEVVFCPVDGFLQFCVASAKL